MVNFQIKDYYGFDDLIGIISLLRSPGGCSWDMEQTHESIRRNFIEEVYEVCEAIDSGDAENLREELGDVLTQVVFHADIEKDAGRFDIGGVCDGVCKKLINRHPHVFGDVKVAGTDEILSNWDEIKKKEKGHGTVADSMRSVAKSLPALWRADKVQGKAEKACFGWSDITGALGKLDEESAELRQAVASGQGIEDELGDVLFTAVNISRFIGADPETVLSSATDKFIARFSLVEQRAADMGLRISDMNLEQLDKFWDEIKLKA